MILEKTAKYSYSKIGKSTLYKYGSKGKIPAVKIEIGRIWELFAYLPNLVAYPNSSDMNKLYATRNKDMRNM